MPEVIDVPAHAVIAPSAGKRWFTCPASVALCMDIPKPPPNLAAAKGSHMHEKLEAYLMALKTGAIDPFDNPEERTIKELAAYVTSYCATYICETQLKLGQLLEITDPGLCFGTADIIGVDEGKTNLHIMDAKFGKVAVQPDDPQLQCYAAGAYVLMKRAGLSPTHIHLHIMQPFGFGEKFKIKTYTAAQFETVAANVKERINEVCKYIALKEAGGSITSGLRPSSSACEYCHGKNECCAYAEPVKANQDGEVSYATMPLHRLEAEYVKALAAKKHADAVIEVFKARLVDEKSDNYTLAKMRSGNAKWNAGVTAEELAEATGLALNEVVTTTLLPVAKLKQLSEGTDLSTYYAQAPDVMMVKAK